VLLVGLVAGLVASLTGCGALTDLDGGTAPLMVTATADDEPAGAAEATRLLQQGADVDEQNVNGVTALMEASGNNTEVLRVLLDHDAEVSLRDDDGWTALTYATFRHDPESVALLLDAGAVDTRPTAGELAGFSTCEIARVRADAPFDSSLPGEQSAERADRAEVERLICER
jgi:ankyrin repeat protein